MKSGLWVLSVLAPLLCTAQTSIKSEPSKEDISGWIENTRSLQSLMRSDPHRPIYHFVAPEGRATPFDPNGAIYWKGKYHLGYIYQRSVGGELQHVWGHAVSSDLLHWTIYPDMLDIQPGDPEKGEFLDVPPGEPKRGIFSGGAFIAKNGVPHLIYHAWGASANMIAYAADDDLKKWVKLKDDSILKEASPDDPKGMICCIPPKSPYSVFDPDAWYDEKAQTYYQITGGMKPGLFKSKDMQGWQYLGALIDPKSAVRDWYEDLSCPEFFMLGDKAMILFISHVRGAQYYVGTFENDKFTVEQHARMNWPGGTFFAPEQLTDGKGRNIIWGWVLQHTRPHHLRDYGWSGIMSLPRVISLDPSGTVQIQPAEELKTIRLRPIDEGQLVLEPGAETSLKANGKSIELQIEMSGGAQSPFGVKVFAAPDGREETVIRYEPAKGELVVDFVKSSLSGPVSAPVFSPDGYDVSKGPQAESFKNRVSAQRAPLKLKKGETLKLNIFLDRSIIEVFANGIQALTQVIYPELETSTGVKIFSGGERVAVKNIRSWSMAETNFF